MEHDMKEPQEERSAREELEILAVMGTVCTLTVQSEGGTPVQLSCRIRGLLPVEEDLYVQTDAGAPIPLQRILAIDGMRVTYTS